MPHPPMSLGPTPSRSVNLSPIPSHVGGGRGNQQARQSGRPVLKRNEDWKTWVELSVRVSCLPKAVTTLELFKTFGTHGSIISIEIYHQGRSSSSAATITFSPAPSQAFWEQPQRNRSTRVELLPKKRSFVHPSPVDPRRSFPERLKLDAEFVHFGIMHSEKSVMAMKTVNSSPSHQVEFKLNLLRRRVEGCFGLLIGSVAKKGGTNLERFRFHIPFHQLQIAYQVHQGSEKRMLIIPLTSPPEFFRRTRNIYGTHDDKDHYWNEFRTWFRQTDIVDDREELRSAAVMLKKNKPIIDIGRWITYCFVFDAKKTEKGKYALILKALSDYNSKVENVDAFEVLNREEASLWKWIDHPKVSDSDEFSSLAALQHDSIHLSFAVRYQLEVCLSHGYLHENNLTRTFVERLASMEPIAARDMLERVADTKRRYFNPMEIFAIQIVRPSSARAVPRYCVYARAATVTPSTIYFATPTVEISNRVIRQYVELEDRFLRVKFTDEKTRGRVSAQDNDAHDEVFTRVKRAMSNGIRLGDRHYEFLAFGNSQFREHGAHFFSPTETVTTADIRKWMGDFSQIKIVSKWAARLGQCFSTTRAINGTKVKVLTIADIKRGHYTFTDGVGKISLFLAQMIAAEFGLPGAYDDPPSLFQFRLGGCKGVLAVAPDAKGREIHVRKSQYKFPAKHEGLEIIRTSSFAAAALNRQIIIVLSSLGVQDSVFTDKLQQNLSDLSQAMDDVKLALRLLLKNVDFNQMTLVIASMILDGFMDKKEPFMMSLLKLWRAFNIKFLKEKARIFIEKGAFLLGCVDETGTLRGHDSRFDANPEKNISEVFLQVPNTEKKGSYTVIQGRCIVARNPSLHPGDVRVVNAVDVPALHHLKNVVVFPQTGDRDIPSMCSGGDLDGDDYMIIWDEELMPTLINYPAMDYEAQTPVRLDRDVTVDDITTFFVLYMKNDRLGSIANAHLVHADRSEDGVMDEKCMRLAQLHSDAVDYPKSGIAARMTRDLRPRMWPHFMEKQKDRTYQSKKVLGQLYDQVERADFAPSYREAFDERILNAYELDDSLLKNATEIKELYDAAVRRIMAQHDIATEFEVWSTFVLEHNQESKSYKFGEEIGNIARALKDRFQNMCFQKAGGKDFAQIGPFAAAMYTITARQVISAVAALYSDQMTPDPKKMPLMSFPWLFVKELGKIALGRFLSTCFSVDEEKTVKKVPKQSPFIPKNGIAGPDDIETAQGTTHRGDLLELFEDTPSGSEAPSGRATPAVQQASKDLLLRTGNVRYSLLDDGETEENWETEDETSEKVIPNDVRATEKCGENLLVGDLNSSDAAESKDTLLEKLEQNHQHEKDAEKLIETRSAAGTPPLANGCSDAAQPSLFPQANGTGTCESVAAESSISHTADIECNEPDDHKLDNERLKSNKDSPPIEGISQDEHLEDGEIEEVYLDNDEGPTALERLAQLVGY